jgi:hypothetical protein
VPNSAGIATLPPYQRGAWPAQSAPWYCCGVGSQLKKAHRTHALAQPAGSEYPHEPSGSGGAAGSADEAERLFIELCDRVPSPSDRAELLEVTLELDEAWRSGRKLPTLRARRKQLAGVLAAVRARPHTA